MARTKGAKNKLKELRPEEKVPFMRTKEEQEIVNKQELEKNDGELSIPPQIKEVIKEVIKYVPEPRLEGFALYKALKDKGFFQGGMGQNMEDPNGTELVYVPHTTEVYTYFLGDPEKWDAMRDAIIRAYIELA